MEDGSNQYALLGAVLAFYWIEQEDRPWIMSNVGPPKYNHYARIDVARHQVMLN